MSLQYLLDTDTCSFAVMGHPKVFTMLDRLERESWAISSLVFAELDYGLVRSTLLPRSALALEKFLASAAVVAFDHKAAREAARVRAHQDQIGKTSGAVDQLIAGHALALGLVLVTANTKHFENVPGHVVENWLTKEIT